VPWVSAITLHPKIAWGGGKKPTAAELESLHHKAHEQCFIAASIKTQVSVSP
jgi:organic hydroperoxide reductase OsmC/OhrA